MAFRRAIVIVLDGVGIGELPDAGAYGDAGSNTLGNIARRVPLYVPMLRELGLGRLIELGSSNPAASQGAVGRMGEASAGKDSVTGHWELTGVVLARPFPVFPSGFPREVIEEFSIAAGRGVIGNRVASGTTIINDLGAEHLATGSLIVYTSADSVFQIAAHEDIVPLAELYRVCEIAFKIVSQGLGVGRVIARPFRGDAGNFTRTKNRRDYALPPPADTLLDRMSAAGLPVIGIGKIDDLFGGRGLAESFHTTSDDEGMDFVEREIERTRHGLIFANLVDFDTVFGHRNDVEGFAANLERFDRRLSTLLPKLLPDDLLIVTGDHGNDPTTPSTDHSREYVPLLVAGQRVARGVDLGTRSTFADVGQTIAAMFAMAPLEHGTSFLHQIDGAAAPAAQG